MMQLCLAAAGMVISLPLQTFTLAWTHSIEKIRWEEDYRVVGSQLKVTEARILGTGAGMEPPPDAVLRDGVWIYHPTIAPQDAVHLARSGFVADYDICWQGKCRKLGALVGPEKQAPEVIMTACAAPAGTSAGTVTPAAPTGSTAPPGPPTSTRPAAPTR